MVVQGWCFKKCSEGTREGGTGGFRDRTSASAAKRDLSGKTARALGGWSVPQVFTLSLQSLLTFNPRHFHMHISFMKESLSMQTCTSPLSQSELTSAFDIYMLPKRKAASLAIHACILQSSYTRT